MKNPRKHDPAKVHEWARRIDAGETAKAIAESEGADVSGAAITSAVARLRAQMGGGPLIKGNWIHTRWKS